MDIFDWVNRLADDLSEQGEHRMGSQILDLPRHCLFSEPEQADAMTREILAWSRQRRHPWLEVYVEHWNVQSQLWRRYDPKAAVPAAVRLLELANRDQARDCPQTICTTEDVAAAYAIADGPSYVEERIAVADEGLARIDPSWGCFACLSIQKAWALNDANRYDEALEYLQAQIERARQAGRSHKAFGGRSARVRALIGLGRFDEALRINRQLKYGDEAGPLGAPIAEAYIQSRLGRFKAAAAVLPSFEKVFDEPMNYAGWSEAVEALVDAGAIQNTWKVGQELTSLFQSLRRKGAVRDAFTTGRRAARLTALRGRRILAREWITSLEQLIAEMRHPGQAAAEIDALKAEIACTVLAVESSSAASPEALLESLAHQDPEVDLEMLLDARRRWPESEALALAQADVTASLGILDRAIDNLRAYLDDQPASAEVVHRLLHLLRRANRPDEASRLAADRVNSLDEQVRHVSHWHLALEASSRGSHDTCREHCHALLDLMGDEPEASGPRALLFAVERDAGNFETALELVDQLASEEPGNHDWDRMLVATLLGRWEVVRDSARRVGLDIPSEGGAIDENWGRCQLVFTEEHGAPSVVTARRTGPVTAVVLEIGRPAEVQHYGDTVVFDATDLNDAQDERSGEDRQTADEPVEEAGEDEAEDGDAERDRQRSDELPNRFAAFRVIKAGGYRSALMIGPHPGEDALTNFSSALDGLGPHALHNWTSEDPIAEDPHTEEPVVEIEIRVAYSAEVEIAALRACIDQHLPHLRCWGL